MASWTEEGRRGCGAATAKSIFGNFCDEKQLGMGGSWEGYKLGRAWAAGGNRWQKSRRGGRLSVSLGAAEGEGRNCWGGHLL